MYLNWAEQVLKKPPAPLTASEIWACIKRDALDTQHPYSNKYPSSTINSLITHDVNDDSVNSRFVIVEGEKPRKFFLKKRKHEIDSVKDETIHDNSSTTNTSPRNLTANYKEIDLHPLLAHFVRSDRSLFGEWKVYTKTINHSKSKGTGYSEWLHPDMVGASFPFGNLDSGIISLGKSLNVNAIKVFSFELKREINKGNYRECFFQTVSNSSWAHEGYLVSSKIADDGELRQELERLNNAFGIGIINLNVEDIYSSSVLFDATPKDDIDWETINKLYTINKDFSSFIDRLDKDIRSDEVHESKYEPFIEDLTEYICKTFK